MNAPARQRRRPRRAPARSHIRAFSILVAAGVIIAAALSLRGRDSDGYRVRLDLSNAAGIRKGSKVTIAGAEVGKVKGLSLTPSDGVRVDLELDPGKTLGRGARASVKASNLLATKFVELEPGDLAHPEPSGVVIADSRVGKAVDLDQLVDVLDADTRTRLGILINEAGLALTGRRADFNALVGRLPATLDAATRVLSDVAADKRALGGLVESSDRFLARLDPERDRLGDLIDVAGETMTTVSARRVQLRATLARAPKALSALRRFLVELRETTKPLGPAAQAISDSSPALAGTLNELAPFEKAARPTLAMAQSAAPTLTKLGEARSVLKRATPTLRSLTSFADALAPISKTLARGGTGGVKHPTAPGAIDDLLGTATSWASGASDRDVAGHIFHGIVTVGADSFLSAVNSWAKVFGPAEPASARGSSRSRRTTKPAAKAPQEQKPAAEPPPSAKPDEKSAAKPVIPLVPVSNPVNETASQLLDFLLNP
jgi:phospholipid/cholesterol/gamma-HCH transport system substrate-binding protein